MIDTVQAISICPQVIQKQFNSSNTICKLWYEMIVFCTDDSFSIIQTQFELVLIISKWSITTVSDSTHHFQNYQTWYFGTLKDVLVSHIKLGVGDTVDLHGVTFFVCCCWTFVEGFLVNSSIIWASILLSFAFCTKPKMKFPRKHKLTALV